MIKMKPIAAKGPDALARTLGLTTGESEDWQVQYTLLKRLRQVVREQELTYAEVARRGQSSRRLVKAILNGNLDSVSSDLLIRLLRALGYRVLIRVSRIETAA